MAILKNSILTKYQNPVIIYYHMVSEKIHSYYPNGSIHTNEFRDQIKILNKNFSIISLPEAIERAISNKQIKNSLVLTVDDGFKECFSVIAPILSDEKIPATFFLIESCIDNMKMMWKHQLEYIEQSLSSDKIKSVIREFMNEIVANSNLVSNFSQLSNNWNMKDKDKFTEIIWKLAFEESNADWLGKNQPYMSTPQIQELINAGFNIGSHSTSHPSCDKLSLEELEKEITGSCKNLASKLGVDIKYFSYPFGRRASREFENNILEQNNIDCLIGGKPRLFRKNSLPFWEAYNFERNKSKLLYHLLVNSFSFK